MMKKLPFISGLLIASLFLTSCLTVEKKEYTFKFTGKEAGELTIIFYNIMSSKEDDKDVSKKDFDDLINNYYKGTKLQEEYPEAKVAKKEMYEENGKLCAKVVLKFAKMTDVKLYQHQGKGPVMLYISSIYENYEFSSGQYGGAVMPVIFWKKSKKLTLTTTVEEPSKKNISLLAKYQDWKTKNSK